MKVKSGFSFHKGKLAWVAWVFCLSLLAQANSFSPPVEQNPKKPSEEERIYLVHADNLQRDDIAYPGAQRLSGRVEFLHNGMRLKCDSAVLYEVSQSFEAYGNVKMTQGDTLSLVGKRLYYRGGTEQIAEVRENVVMTHRNQKLYADSLNYDRLYNFAYYFDGGKLVDGQSVLESDWGEYHTDTKRSTFQYNVVLNHPKFQIVTDTLHYDTQTKWANVAGPSNIYSDDSRIYTERGAYNTASEQVELYDRSRLFNKETEMVGDSIYYDKKTGDMKAYRNIIYNDRKNKNILYGDYCQYNELDGSALAYGNALAKDYSSGTDTLFVHADTIRLQTFNMNTDSIHRVMHGSPHVRAFRSDVQAVADSLVFRTLNKSLSLYKDPIVWSDNRQIVGEQIDVFSNDSTIDSVYVRRQAILIEKVDSVHYNQVAGQEMRSYFEKGEMTLNCVDGNVYVVNYPLERDSTILYQNYTETTKLRMYMENRKMKRLWAPASKGCFYVVGLAPEERTFLSNFAWFDYIRPRDKYDLYEWRPKKSGTELRPSVRHEAPLQHLSAPK